MEAAPLAAGESRINAFGAREWRVTDQAMSVGINSTGYSSYCPISTDGRYLAIGLAGEAALFGLAPSAPATRLRPLMAGSGAGAVEWDLVFWDQNVPSVCYVTEPAKLRIWRVNVDKVGAAQFSEYRRFNAEFPTGTALHQTSSSENGKVWAFHVVLPDGTVCAYVWDAQNPGPDANGRLTGTLHRFIPTVGQAPIKVCRVSPCGSVVRVMLTDETVVLWRWREDVEVVIPATDLARGIVEHVDWTREWFAGGRKADNALVYRSLGDPLNDIRAVLPISWKHAWHVALHRDFALLSFYEGDRTWEAFELELVKVYHDGTFVRFAHTESWGIGGSPTVKGVYVVTATDWRGYEQQPRAAASKDGRLAVYTRGAPDGTTDVYIVEIPGNEAELAARDNETALLETLNQQAALSRAQLDQRTVERDSARAAASDLQLALGLSVADCNTAQTRLAAIRTAGGWQP